MISNFDSTSAGTKTLTATYGGVGKTFTIKVSGANTNEDKKTKTVSIYVKGDSATGTILSSRSCHCR